LTSLSFLLLAFGLAGYLRYQPHFPGTVNAVWRGSLILACVSATTLEMSYFLEDTLRIRWLGWVWVVRILALLVALVAVGMSAFWIKRLPRRVGFLLLVSTAGVLMISSFGWFLFGFAKVVLGLPEHVWRNEPESTV
jgi:hypothetical protein